MEELRERALTPYMNVMLQGLPKNITLYELMLRVKAEGEKLYNQAYSDGYRQRDSDKVLEQIK